MGAVNLSVLNKAKWRERTLEAFSSAARMMCETFSIDSLYPTREVERPLGSGQYIEVQQAMQHQAVYHAKKTPSGKDPKFVLLSGGMGCFSGDTLINGIPGGDLAHGGVVSTMFGEAVSSPVYRKGSAGLWKVTLRSGRSIVVTEGHRFLTLSGWRPLADLAVGDVVASDGSENDNSRWETPTGYRGRYCPYFHPCDEALSPAGLAVRLGQNTSYAPDTSLPCIHPYPSIGSFSLPPSPILRAAASSRHDGSDAFGSLHHPPPDSSQSGMWTPPRYNVGSHPPSATYSEGSTPLKRSDPTHSGAELQSESIHRNALPPSSQYRVPETYEVLPDGLILSSASCSSTHKDTSFWDEVSSIQWQGEGDFYDLTVPGAEHYSAHGIFNHNSGKSVAACVELLWLLRTYPGLQVCVVAAFDYYFDEFFLPTWHSIFSEEENPLIKRHNVKSRTTVLTNGSVLRCKAYDDADRIKGWQAHVIFIMEAGLLGDRFPQKARAIFNALTERLRAPGRHMPRRIYLDQNPEGHNWSWELFIKPNPLGDAGKVTYIPADDWYPNGGKYREYEHTTSTGDTYYTISCGTALNPFNPPDYLATMLDVRNEDPAMISRKIEGDFTPIHSLIYGTYWTPDTHIIPIEKILAYWELDRDGMMGVDAIPRDWPIHVGIDPAGNSSPWAIEIYVETPPDEYGNNQYLAIDEIYVKGYSWGEMAEMILKRTIDKGWNSIHYWIDPFFGNQKHGPNPKSVREEFLEYGINCQIPRNYTKLPAIERVREFLRCDNAHPHPYVEDEIEDDVESPHFGKWKKGTSMLYYVSSPEYVSSNPKKFNPHGVINWYNLKEKEVYRLDGRMERQSKENEEGLSKAGPEKIIDRDDHAQTAEMFVALGIRPLMRTGRERGRTQLRTETPKAYTTQTARERFAGRRG